MANYNREDMEKDSEKAKGLVGLLALIGVGVAAYANESNKKSSKKQELLGEIQLIDREISNLKSGFLGSVFNSSEIDKLQAERNKLLKEYNSL